MCLEWLDQRSRFIHLQTRGRGSTHCAPVVAAWLLLGLPYDLRWIVLFPVEILHLALNLPAFRAPCK
jgi:hypothetical protein